MENCACGHNHCCHPKDQRIVKSKLAHDDYGKIIINDDARVIEFKRVTCGLCKVHIGDFLPN
jgi:hypothetical protein